GPPGSRRGGARRRGDRRRARAVFAARARGPRRSRAPARAGGDGRRRRPPRARPVPGSSVGARDAAVGAGDRAAAARDRVAAARPAGTGSAATLIMSDPRVAIVHEWLVSMRGGERVLESLCRLYPRADVFTLRYDRRNLSPEITSHAVKASFVDP